MLRLSIKLSPIPELKAANLSKQHLEPVWRSAANGVATAVKTHFLSLGGSISREGESVFPGNVRFRLLSRNPKITRHKNGTEDYEFDVEEA